VFLTPAEIQQLELKSRGRGYERQSVDHVLEHATRSYEQVWRERDELRERVTQLEDDLASFRANERHLRESLVTAQRTAETVRNEARHEAVRIVEEARANSVESAQEAARERDRIAAEVARLEGVQRELQGSLRALLLAGLELVENAAPEETETPSGDLADVLRSGVDVASQSPG